MSSKNPFLKDIDFYQRDIDPIGQYADQTAFYISKMTGKPIERCREVLIQSIQDKTFPAVKNPTVHYFERNEYGDRHPNKDSLRNYIKSTFESGDILAPTFTTYHPPSVKKSLLVDFIDSNVKQRAIAKKAAAKAKSEGNSVVFVMKNNEQENKKRYNNNLSGSFATTSSVFYNPTGHSTLTSITRSESSIGNSLNEKIIAGNRHYYNPDVTLNNVISLASSVDKVKMTSVMDKYNLHYPTSEEVMKCLKYSTDFYWVDPREHEKIKAFVDRLEPIERAAVVYIGDFYHIRQYNEEFVKTFILKLSKKVRPTIPVEDVINKIYQFDEQLINYVHQVCMSEVKGVAKDYTRISEEARQIVYATAVNIKETVEQYQDFIDVIFLTNNLPASTAYIRNMVRRAVVLSDTDSTMFSVDEWVTWYFGKLLFTEEAYVIAGAVMYVSTQSVAHGLALFSANMGVERSRIFQIQMKPEYVFNCFCASSVSKHYFTAAIVKEGSVFSDMEMEIKGVNLISSASPRDLIKDAHSNMKNIILRITEGKKLSIKEAIQRVIDIEYKIMTSLKSNESKYYKTSKVKLPESYASDAELSPYRHHVFWQDVMEPKYGQLEPVPYTVIKIPTILKNKTALKDWVNSIKDPELKDRLEKWIVKTNKTNLNTIYINKTYIDGFGMPEEIVDIINYKKIILELTIPERYVLEIQGYFPKGGWLISELHANVKPTSQQT